MPDKPQLTYLLWFDAETTGLDPTMDPPLEIAGIFTDMNLDTIAGADRRFHFYLPYTQWVEERLFSPGNEIALQMHQDNGLIDDLKKVPAAMQYDTADDAMVAMMETLPEGAVALAGTGVAAFDLHLIRSWFPRTAERLDYRTIDVGHLRRFLKDICRLSDSSMNIGADDKHRARGDVMNAIDQAKHMRSMVQGWLDMEMHFGDKV